jgi:hypothetical protein
MLSGLDVESDNPTGVKRVVGVKKRFERNMHGKV